MRNVCFLNTTKFWGGGEKLHLEYAVKFAQRGYNVFIATSKDSPLHKKAIEHNIKVFNISLKNLSFLNVFKYLQLYSFLKKENIDTVIFSSSPDLKTGGFSSKIAKLENIVYLRGLAVPVKNTFLNRILFKDVITDVIANSIETQRTVLTNLSKSIDIEEKLKVIYHGIDLDPIDERANLSSFSKKEEIIIGNAGRLTNQKGQKDFIEIALKLKEKGLKFKIHIAGTGELEQELQELIAANKLQNEVVLLGFIADMDSFMKNLDVFVLTSAWEGFGYVIVEAMAASKPVVAYNISSNPEIIKDNETGFLVDFKDINMFAEKIEILLKDADKRMQFGKNGRKYTEDNFQLDDRITELIDYMNQKN